MIAVSLLLLSAALAAPPDAAGASTVGDEAPAPVVERVDSDNAGAEDDVEGLLLEGAETAASDATVEDGQG